jgi:hypothetical protein
MEVRLTNSDFDTPVFHVSADLWPGDAHAVRVELAEWLAAQTSTATVELGPESSRPAVSALQLLLAASCRTSGPPPDVGEIASAALAELADRGLMEWKIQ